MIIIIRIGVGIVAVIVHTMIDRTDNHRDTMTDDMKDQAPQRGTKMMI